MGKHKHPQYDAIRKAVADGKTTAEIMAELGVSRHVVTYWRNPEKKRRAALDWFNAHPKKREVKAKVTRVAWTEWEKTHPQEANRWQREHPEERKAYWRKWSAENRDKVRAAGMRHHLRKAYGMTPEDRAAMIEAQGGFCASCGDVLPEKTNNQHIDHDHETGQVRGILCRGCNVAVGMLRDSSLRARKLAAYIDKHAPKLRLVKR